MVEKTAVHQRQGLLHACCDGAVCRRWLGITRRMIVKGDNCSSVQQDSPTGDFPWVHLSAIDGAVEQIFASKDLMAAIEKQASEDFAFGVSAPSSKILSRLAWLRNLAVAFEPAQVNCFGGVQNFIVGAVEVTALGSHRFSPMATCLVGAK
jgi:hypothetical protein